MPSIQNTAEGLTNGTTVTTANSGGVSGTAASTVSIATGGTLTASNARPAHGAMGYAFGYPALGGAHRLMFPFAEANRGVWSVYFETSSVVTDFDDVIGVRHSAGNLGILSIGSDGKLIMANAAGAGQSASRATDALAANTRYRVEMEVNSGTTTTNGTLGYRYFLGDSTTPIFSWTSAVMDAGTANISHVFAGRSTSRSTARTVYYDTLRAESLVSGWIAPYVEPNTAPTITLAATTADIVPGSTVTLTATAADADGTTPTVTFTQASGTPTVTLSGTGNTRTYTAPPTMDGTVLTFTATASDGVASTVSNTVTHTVLPSAARVVSGGVFVPAFLNVGTL